MSLEEGLKALQKYHYSEAVQLLEEYCQRFSNFHSPFYIQAKMSLARAYRGNNQREKAVTLAHELENHLDTQVNSWAKGFLSILDVEDKTTRNLISDTPIIYPKAGRSPQIGVKLDMNRSNGNLALASTVTILLMLGISLSIFSSLFLLICPQNPLQGLIFSFILTLIFNSVIFFTSPWLMDFMQQWLYKTRWVTLAEIKRNSPEAAIIIGRVCREKNINPPKLGIIADRYPTAFTYGSLPSNARLVVSQGLFTYLDDDEIATVYAHELGHIVHWDFALMTIAASLVQITYLIFIFADNFHQDKDNNNKFSQVIKVGAIIAPIFSLVGTYLTLYLSRTREYFADHFAAQATGNPNGLSRALVKIAYGILSENQNASEPSRLLEGTRILGIYDPKTATTTGTAYRVAKEPRKIAQVFLWDIFNPWGWWMELNSTHPLTGKRICALTTYAQQMGLDTEFNMAQVIREEHQLKKSQLYQTFFLDICLYHAELIGIILGLILGGLWFIKSSHILELISLVLIGFGLGTLIKTFVMYPSLRNANLSNIFALMCDPYVNPLRGRPVYLQGKLIGKNEAGYSLSSELMLKDPTGIITIKARQVIGENVKIVGWFRRGASSWLDWKQITYDTSIIKSYPYFWSNLTGIISIMIGVMGLIHYL